MGSPSYDKDVEKNLRFYYHSPSSSTPVETDLKSDKEFDFDGEEIVDLDDGDFDDIFSDLDEEKETTKKDDGDAHNVHGTQIMSSSEATDISEAALKASAQEAARKDEVAMNELIKQANKSCPEDEIIFGGWLYNKIPTQNPLHLFAEKTWSGDYFKKHPNNIEKSGSFVQTAEKKNGIKSAVVYSCKFDKLPFGHVGYLLAWFDSIDEDGNNIKKTYGYRGLLENFNKIEWNNVEKNLNEASSSFSYIDKSFTGTSMKARIVANVIYAEFYEPTGGHVH